MASQHASPHSQIKPIFVGFAGRMGAGKTSAARYLSSKHGFQYTRYSQVLQDWLSPGASGGDRLQRLGWDVMGGGLQAELNSRLIAGLDRSRSAAIDGLRHPIDFESLSSTFGSSFRLVLLEAREKIRFERLRSRFQTYAAFQAAEPQPVEAHIDSLRPLASATIPNDGPLESLHQRLEAWIATCGVGDHH